MTIWVLRFISYGNPQSFDAYFKTEARAVEVWNFVQSEKALCDPVEISDDYGVRILVDAVKCAVILTNTDASAAFNAELTKANKEAGAMRFVPGVENKSTVQ